MRGGSSNYIYPKWLWTFSGARNCCNPKDWERHTVCGLVTAFIGLYYLWENGRRTDVMIIKPRYEDVKKLNLFLASYNKDFQDWIRTKELEEQYRENRAKRKELRDGGDSESH